MDANWHIQHRHHPVPPDNTRLAQNPLAFQYPGDAVVVPWQHGPGRRPAPPRGVIPHEDFAVPWQLPRTRGPNGDR